MDRIFNSIKAQARSLDQRAGQPRFATVASVNPGTATARVMLQPEGMLSGWLPILSAWTGAGWGMVCPPQPGDQVLVVPQESDAENAVIIGRAYSDVQAPPGAPAGELWLVHRSGSFFKLQNDGTLRVRGDLHVDGDVYDRTGSLNRLRNDYNQHVHTDSRGGLTSVPDRQEAS